MLRGELAALRGSMNSILKFQYFITKDMRAELGRGEVSRGGIDARCQSSTFFSRGSATR